jgi:DNA polymerase-3 subunit gamma/tau
MASFTITEHLNNVLTKENITFEPTAIQLIARAADGSMRDALSLTDQAIAYGNQTVNEAEVRTMLGAIDQTYLFEIIQALINNDGDVLISKAKEMEIRSLSFEAALNDLANLLHQIAIAQTVPSSIENDYPEREALLNIAQKIPAETLQLYYQIALLGRRDIGLAPDEYAGFTMSLLRMLAFSPKEKLPLKKTEPEAVADEAKQASASASEAKSATTQAKITAPIVADSTEVVDTPHTPRTEDKEERLFNGNWRNLVENNLKLGLARALAQQCEMVAYDENSITLRVAENQKHLINTNYQNKLSHAINEHFGKKIRLTINVESEANSPAKQNAAEKAIIQSDTEKAIMDDEFVKTLIDTFDAQVIPNTIKPIH